MKQCEILDRKIIGKVISCGIIGVAGDMIKDCEESEIKV
jgi:hypothetical protein